MTPWYSVMAGLVPTIHVCKTRRKDVDARHKAGHDERVVECHFPSPPASLS